MGKIKDLTNQRFGKLTVIKDSLKRQNGSVLWECQCECGNIHYAIGANLKSGDIKSCGCLRKKLNTNDISNKKFGKLTAVFPTQKRDGDGNVVWFCQCECGGNIEVSSHNLNRGDTQSCGCLRSKGETKIVELLAKNKILYVREKTFEDCILPSGYKARFDFYIENKYLIEFDGLQHFTFENRGWHTYDKMIKTQNSDDYKNQWCREKNIPLIRIPYSILPNLKIEDLLLESSKYII